MGIAAATAVTAVVVVVFKYYTNTPCWFFFAFIFFACFWLWLVFGLFMQYIYGVRAYAYTFVCVHTFHLILYHQVKLQYVLKSSLGREKCVCFYMTRVLLRTFINFPKIDWLAVLNSVWNFVSLFFRWVPTRVCVCLRMYTYKLYTKQCTLYSTCMHAYMHMCVVLLVVRWPAVYLLASLSCILVHSASTVQH